MSLEYEPSLEPLNIYVKELFFTYLFDVRRSCIRLYELRYQGVATVQGYLAHKKTHPPQDYRRALCLGLL